MPTPKETLQDIHFPKAGVDVSRAFVRQSARPSGDGRPAIYTCADAENVRGYDADGRFRGGSRPGLARYVNAPVKANFIVQHLDVVVGDFDDQTGATVQASSSGRVINLVAVGEGTVYTLSPGDTAWTTPTNNANTTPALNPTGIIYSSVLDQKMYFADGVNWVYYDPVTGTVEDWVSTVVDVDLPEDDDGNPPRLIATWRGRIVVGGFLKDSQNYWMSRVNDAGDFNTGSLVTDDPAQALEAQNTDYGLIGDVLTGLCPLSNDTMLFFGDHTFYRFDGDPFDGGKVYKVSGDIGAAWGKAFCRAPDGTIFFFSNTCCIYAVSESGAPVRISQAIDPILKDINTGTYTVSMIYSDRFQGFHVFITKTSAQAETTHYFYDVRANAWWPDKLAHKKFNPLVCCTLDGNLPNDRVALIGSWDGYVRYFSPDATTDDGIEFTSFVFLGPILTKDFDTVMLKTLQPIMGSSSGTVSYSIHVGKSPEAALASAAVKSGTWTADRNLTSQIQRSGHAIYVKLRSNSRWAMEAIRAAFPDRPFSKTRRRGR